MLSAMNFGGEKKKTVEGDSEGTNTTAGELGGKKGDVGISATWQQHHLILINTVL